MKALLIDPVAQTITEVEYSGRLDGPNGVYEHVCAQPVDTVDLRNKPGDMLYLDDNGLVGPDPIYLFRVPTCNQPLAGKALVVGTYPYSEGEWADDLPGDPLAGSDLEEDFHAGYDDCEPGVTLDELRAQVVFMGPFSGDDRPQPYFEVWMLNSETGLVERVGTYHEGGGTQPFV